MTSCSGIERVLIAGGGTMGQEIAVYCVHHGFDVRVFDLNPHAFQSAAEAKAHISQIVEHSPEWALRRQEILRTLTVHTDLETAAQGADLVIECIPERLNLKRDFFQKISRQLPPPALLATNSSMLVPSQIAPVVAQPERFAALHFLNESAALEIMGHAATAPATLERLALFARQIAHRPIVALKENPGHLLNDMLTKLMFSALCLAANGVGDVEEIDRVWMMALQARVGPFGNLDLIGLDTVLEITQVQATLTGDPQLKRNIEFLKEYVRQGKLGVKTGRGFYEYPNPKYLQPEFVRVDPLPGPQRAPAAAPAVAPPPAPLASAPAADTHVRPALLEALPEDQAGVDGRAAALCRVDPQRDGFWRDHVAKGTPLLPAAATLELFAEAVGRGAHEPVAFRDLVFHNGVRSFNGQPQQLLVEIDRARTPAVIELRQEFRNQAGKLLDPRRLCAAATIDPLISDWPAPPESWPAGPGYLMQYADEGAHHLGPTMRGLRRMMYAARSGWGEIVAVSTDELCPERQGRAWRHSIPAIDAALVCCSQFTTERLGGAWQLPLSIGRVQLGRAPRSGEVCRAHFRAVRLSESEPESEYEISIWGDDGACLIHFSEYRCKIMRTAEKPASAAIPAGQFAALPFAAPTSAPAAPAPTSAAPTTAAAAARPLPAVQPSLAGIKTPAPSAPAAITAELFSLALRPATSQPAPVTAWPRPTRAALILGDNADARALRTELTRLGVTVTLLSTAESTERTLAALDAAWKSQSAPTLFLLTARDPEAAQALERPEIWRRRRDVGVERPYRVCQRWLQLLQHSPLRAEAALVAATALGGDFGFQQRCPAVEGGALAGLLKGLDTETGGKVLVKVVDLPSDAAPTSVSAALLQELACGPPETEAAYRGGQRFVVRAQRFRPQPPQPRSLRRGGVWVVTGGARGITALAALELAQRHQLHMQLLGSSAYQPVPDAWVELGPAERQAAIHAAAASRGTPAAAGALARACEIQATLAGYRRAGLPVDYHPCDIADFTALQGTLERIRAQHGPIAGVIHGAGVSLPRPIEKQTPERLRQVLAAKLDGLAHLCWLLQSDPVDYFVGFGSTSGRFGAFCNADYSLANEMMSKMVSEFRRWRPAAVTLSLLWTAWDEAGMCLEPSMRASLQAMRVRLMPASEGVARFCTALETDGPDHELLVTEHPGGVHSGHITLSEAG